MTRPKTDPFFKMPMSQLIIQSTFRAESPNSNLSRLTQYPVHSYWMPPPTFRQGSGTLPFCCMSEKAMVLRSGFPTARSQRFHRHALTSTTGFFRLLSLILKRPIPLFLWTNLGTALFLVWQTGPNQRGVMQLSFSDDEDPLGHMALGMDDAPKVDPNLAENACGYATFPSAASEQRSEVSTLLFIDDTHGGG